jgi:hypothetical protein
MLVSFTGVLCSEPFQLVIDQAFLDDCNMTEGMSEFWKASIASEERQKIIRPCGCLMET